MDIAYMGACIGAGLSIIGAGVGIGILAFAALQGIARQPEALKDIRANMILAAALIEGLAFLALIICLLIIFK